MQKEKMKYLVSFILLLSIEVCIALFIHDQFVRPYIGDVLVVVVIYCFIRIILPKAIKGLPLYIFLFATLVEVLQYFRLVEQLGLQNNTFLRILIGSTFDIKDIICYAVGCALLGGYELFCKTYWYRTKRASTLSRNQFIRMHCFMYYILQ